MLHKRKRVGMAALLLGAAAAFGADGCSSPEPAQNNPAKMTAEQKVQAIESDPNLSSEAKEKMKAQVKETERLTEIARGMNAQHPIPTSNRP